MKTRKPVTTISYNSPEYLMLKLEELRRAKIISVWFFLEHQPEEDEKKEHIHLYIMPAKQIQTDDIVDELREFDPLHPEAPRKCLHFRSCHSFPDWYLYTIHDKGYLLSKNQKRKYSYLQEEFVCSDSDELNEMVREIDMTEYSAFARMRSAFDQGLSFQEYFLRGSVPIQQIRQYQIAWEVLLAREEVNRPGESHTPRDPEDEA